MQIPDSGAKSSSFCILPWMHLATTSSGVFRLCCNSTPGLNLIRSAKGVPYTASSEASIQEIWNSPLYLEVRKKMLSGEWHPACSRCQTEEKNGVKSSRIGWNEDFQDLIEDAVSQTSENGSAPVKIRYMDLRMGNVCNLKCRMCNPYASRKWLDDWDQVFNPLDAAETARLKDLDWFENPRAWELLTRALKDCIEIYFTGGEPLAIETHWRFLRYCIRKNLASQIILKYNTNTTFANRSLFDMWRHFKMVRLNCSVDGVGELNEYIRAPSKWGWVHTKLTMLNEEAKVVSNLHLKIHTTVQSYNFLHLTEIFDLLKSLPSFKNLPFLNILDRPAHFNIRTLPLELKELGLERIDRWMKDNSSVLAQADPVYVERMKSLRQYVMSEAPDHLSFEEFRGVTRKLDVLREQNICQVVPEFAPYFSDQPAEVPSFALSHNL